MDHSERDGVEVFADDEAAGLVVMAEDDEPEHTDADGQAEQDDDAEPERPRLEASTGLLTPGQHKAVGAWMERLRRNEPLPGIERKGDMLRWLGIDDRPPASISDVIAASVHDLCKRRTPPPLDIARYFVEARRASREQDPARGKHKPVTVIFREELALTVEALPREVAAWLHETRQAAVKAAAAAHPGEDEAAERKQYVELRLIGLGIREAYSLKGMVRTMPVGLIARMGIDHWRHKPVDEALLAALDYALDVKLQMHRMRKDAHHRK